jgi:hypothetical protein
MTTQSAVLLVLELDPCPLAWQVSLRPVFGDHAVEPGSLELLKPLSGNLRITGHRRQPDLAGRSAQQPLEPLPACAQRELAQVPGASRQEIEGDVGHRHVLGEQPHAGIG